MIVNGVEISTEAYNKAEEKFGYVPTSNDELVAQNRFLILCAKIQEAMNENERKINNINIED
jgi:hypothetical protein